MTRLMYDSTTSWAIPSNAQMVAGYIDGRYAWSAFDWSRFPNSVAVRIAISALTNDGHVLDVEDGCATADESPSWTDMRRRSGLATPAVYCGLYNPPGTTQRFSLADVMAAHDAQGIGRPLVWLGGWDGKLVIPPGCIAHQYANAAMLGFHADASVVADFWPGVDAAPQPQPPSPTTGPDVSDTLDRIETAFKQVDELRANLQGMKENLTYP